MPTGDRPSGDAAVEDISAGDAAAGDVNATGNAVQVVDSVRATGAPFTITTRSAGAVAMGPVLQGLNKPINDLSRGALVEDIVNTIAITAIQAQNADAASPEARA